MVRFRCGFLLIFIVFASAVLAASPQRLFILLGQSNMAGRAAITSEDTLPLPLVRLLNGQGAFEEARNPLNRYSNIRKDISMQKMGPGYTFAGTVAAELQDTIFIIVNARGGTAIERFMKNDSTGYYEKTIFRIKQAMKNYPDLKPEAIIWHQGESNRDNYEDYIVHLRTLTEDYRRDLNTPELPLIVGEIGEWNPKNAFISEKIKLIPDSIPNAYLVSSKGLKNIDEFHFDTVSQRELGRRYAAKYLELLTKKTGK